MKKLIPPSLKAQLRYFLILLKDMANRSYFRFATYQKSAISPGNTLEEQVTISQPIKKSPFSSNKRDNLIKAVETINNLVIRRGQILSFWHLLGYPSTARGYKKGRCIQQGNLTAADGGGLCQLSGLLYYLALKSGLTIIERHAHSQDLYNEHTRYTPLGSDAAVVYGYKDLRIQNNLDMNVCFRFSINSDSVIGAVCASKKITEKNVEFITTEQDRKIKVLTCIAEDQIVINSLYEVYKQPGL